MKEFGGRVVDLALSVLAAVVLVSFAWSIIRPLVPLLLVLGVVLASWRFITRRRRYL